MDELWHSFILFTKKYHDFCYRVAGDAPSIPSDKPNEFVGYMQLLQDYKVLFSEEPPTQYWPRSQKESAGIAVGGSANGENGGVGGNRWERRGRWYRWERR